MHDEIWFGITEEMIQSEARQQFGRLLKKKELAQVEDEIVCGNFQLYEAIRNIMIDVVQPQDDSKTIITVSGQEKLNF